MSNWVRAFVVAAASGVSAAVACGGAPTYTPPPKEPCPALAIQMDPVAQPPHGADLCPAGPCNYQTQVGCAAGEVCAPHVDTTKGVVVPHCRPAGAVQKNGACDNSSPDRTKQCDIGLECVEGKCRTMCCGFDWSACDEGESCIVPTEMTVMGPGLPDAGALTETGQDVCFPVGGCDPLKPDSCPPGGKSGNEARECRIADKLGRVACLLPKPLKEGDPCSGDNQCGGGLICAGSPTMVCSKLCPWNQCVATTCTAEKGTCVHFTRDPPNVGECTPNFHGKFLVVDGGFVGDAAALLPPPPPPSGDGG